MKNFGPDFYNITDLLTDEELLIQKTAYDFVQTEFIPLINEHYEKATFPMELAPKLGELGFMGSVLPEESGGAGISNVAYGLVLHELERGDSGLRSFASVQGALVMYPIHAYGSDEQKAKWLPDLGAGTKIGCFGLTEPNFGSRIWVPEPRSVVLVSPNQILVPMPEAWPLTVNKMEMTGSSMEIKCGSPMALLLM